MTAESPSEIENLCRGVDLRPCEIDGCDMETAVTCYNCARSCCLEHRGWQPIKQPPFGVHHVAVCDLCLEDP